MGIKIKVKERERIGVMPEHPLNERDIDLGYTLSYVCLKCGERFYYRANIEWHIDREHRRRI